MPTSISVIIPTYNRLSSLPRAIESVLAQTLIPDEICVVDDGSSDGSAAFIRQQYPQVKVITQTNKGVSAARNTGIANTAGSWLAFLDSDDEWLPTKLELQMQLLSNNSGHHLIHGEEIWIRNGLRVNAKKKYRKAGGMIFDQCLELCAISPSTTLLSRELLGNVGNFDEQLVACEDYDLWLRVCCEYEVLFVEQALIKKYGGHADQLSMLHWGMDRFRIQALEKILDSNRLSSDQFHMARLIFLKKCKIFLSGAQKRGQLESVQSYERKLLKYAK